MARCPTTWRQRAAVGDTLTFTGPNGSFFLRETDRPVLLLAGGTGLAPVLSMLRAMRRAPSTRTAHLIYGVSTDEDLVALDEIDSIAAHLGGFTWEHCVSDPESTAEHKGYVTGLIEPEHLHDGDVAVYLCGPPPMVEAVPDPLVRRVASSRRVSTTRSSRWRAPRRRRNPVATLELPGTPAQALLMSGDARAIAGQVMHPHRDVPAGPGAAFVIDDAVAAPVRRRTAAGAGGGIGSGDVTRRRRRRADSQWRTTRDGAGVVQQAGTRSHPAARRRDRVAGRV